jgi:hypothetical protein
MKNNIQGKDGRDGKDCKDGKDGKDGKDAPAIPEGQLKDAVAQVLKTIPIPTPVSTVPGPPGPPGPPGAGVAPEVVEGAVASALSGVSGFLSAPADFIWDVIIKGIRANFMALFEALLTEEKK